MKRIGLALLALLGGGVLLGGCGGGGGAAVTPIAGGRAITGQALVPAGATRAAGDEPLAGATASLTDITAGLPGTAAKTVTTDAEGRYRFDGVTAGRVYMLVVSKLVYRGGASVTLSLGAVARVPENAVQPTEAQTDVDSTVALGQTLALLAEGGAIPSEDIETVFAEAKRVFAEAREEGSAPPVDLGKPCTDPDSHKAAAQEANAEALETGAYLSRAPEKSQLGQGGGGGAGKSGDRGHVNLLFDDKTRKLELALFILDSRYEFFDADYLAATLSEDGRFEAVTADNQYRVAGRFTGRVARGAWAALDGSTSGEWQATLAQNGTPDANRAYAGIFQREGEGKVLGRWMLFVHHNGLALLYVRDEDNADRSHLLKNAVFAGEVGADGVLSGGMELPARTGSMTGPFPARLTVSGEHKNGSDDVSLEGEMTGQLVGDRVEGVWRFAGQDRGKPYDSRGVWTGAKF